MNYSEQQLSAAVTSDGLRPVLAGSELGTPPGLGSLIEQCWNGNPTNRPSFNYIVDTLNQIIADSSLENPKSGKVSPVVSETDTLDYTQQTKTDVDWAARVVEEITSTAARHLSTSPVWLSSEEEVSGYLPVLSIGSFATKGARQTMEDTLFLIPHLGGAQHVSAFGVFDGHRGKMLSQTAGIINPF